MPNGVNFFGPCQALDSIGRAAKLNIYCLESSRIQHEVHMISRPGPNEAIDYGVIDENLMKSLKYNINIFHFNARRAPQYFSRINKSILRNFYNIGYWVHEMQTFPEYWAKQLEYYDEIWTPSSLCQAAISYSANIPVLKIPHPVEGRSLSKRILAIQNGINFPTFTFLTIFDVYSDAERKNPLFAIRAFLNAYENNKNIQFVLKIRNLSLDQVLTDKLRKITEKFSNIKIIDGYLSEDDLNKLYANADAYVSLHRAEGFGLTITDAMSRGIPVICTGYSGNLDFCNASETRLVTYLLRQIGHNRPRYRSDDLWAEPNLDDATAAFADLVNNHVEWICKAARARNRILNDFSILRVGEIMKNRIELIDRKFQFKDDMNKRCIDIEIGISNSYGF